MNHIHQELADAARVEGYDRSLRRQATLQAQRAMDFDASAGPVIRLTKTDAAHMVERLSTSASPLRPSTANSGPAFFLSGGDGGGYVHGAGRQGGPDDDRYHLSSETDLAGGGRPPAPAPGADDDDDDDGDAENRAPGSVGGKDVDDVSRPRPGSAPRGGSSSGNGNGSGSGSGNTSTRTNTRTDTSSNTSTIRVGV